MANNKTVRLIFNGQVLSPDTKTLRACGLFDDCVVHCLVRNTPPPPPPPQTPAAAGTAAGGPLPSFGDVADAAVAAATAGDNDAPTERCFNVVYLVVLTILVSLLSVWYMYIQYAHMFTTQSNVGLILLTLMGCSVAMMIMWSNRYLWLGGPAPRVVRRVPNAQTNPNARPTDAVFPPVAN